MGVRFYDKENMSNEDNFTATTRANYNCNVLSFSAPTTSITRATQTTSSINNGNTNINTQKSGSLREIVGNCKEMRIENNIHNLRIVGNNNRIRIMLNVGDITIVGNNTRLKIKINHGLIKYTGNNGRISLGKESTEQLVDYNGCNGVLKVQNSKNSSQVKSDDDDEMNDNSTMGSTHLNEKLSNSEKQKYASFSGSSSGNEAFKSHNKFYRKRSVPNITKPFHSDNESSNCVHPLPRSIVPSFGDIVIANSSNVCISPNSYTY